MRTHGVELTGALLLLSLVAGACFGTSEASLEPPPITVTGNWTLGPNLSFELPFVYALLLPVGPSSGRAPCLENGLYDGGRRLRLPSEVPPGEFEAASFPYVREGEAYVAAAAWRAIVIASREDADGSGVELAWGVATATVTASAFDCPQVDLVRFEDANGDELPCMRADVSNVGEVVIDRPWTAPVCP